MRLFVAVPIPDPARGQILRLLGQLREGVWPVRWVHDEGLHMTLKFFGEVAPERLDVIIEALRFAAQGAGPLPLRLGRSEEHTSELQSHVNLVCRLLLEKKKSLARSGLASPVTTSAGRLFDAAAALCGIGLETTYECQAAIEFEAASDPSERRAYPMAGLDPRPALHALVADLEQGVAVSRFFF